jgi:hypothetical protein
MRARHPPFPFAAVQKRPGRPMKVLSAEELAELEERRLNPRPRGRPRKLGVAVQAEDAGKGREERPTPARGTSSSPGNVIMVGICWGTCRSYVQVIDG